MSSGEQANQQPPALENFLIVAYRSLRGNKRVSAFGCPKDLLDASEERIHQMSQNSFFVREYANLELLHDFKLKVTDHNHYDIDPYRYLLLKRPLKSKHYCLHELEYHKNGTYARIESILRKQTCSSYFVHAGGFSGLTVIIHDCYVVILSNRLPRVFRYYKDEEGQIKCETTAIPVKPQHSYYNGWGSNNRSYAHHFTEVAFIAVDGRLAVFNMDNPGSVHTWSPGISKASSQPAMYVDVTVHDHSKFGLFAVTACGRIDYYQGAKRLVHSHTFDLNKAGIRSPIASVAFTTICCDDQFIGVAFMTPGLAIKNSVAVLKINRGKHTVTGLKEFGTTQYSVEKAAIPNQNSAHHLAFMYPKRYRILYAQQLFNLGCLFYVGRQSPTLVMICTMNLHTSRFPHNPDVAKNFTRLGCSRTSFIMTTDRGKLVRVRISLEGRNEQNEVDTLKKDDYPETHPHRPKIPAPKPRFRPLRIRSRPGDYDAAEHSLELLDPSNGTRSSSGFRRMLDPDDYIDVHELLRRRGS